MCVKAMNKNVEFNRRWKANLYIYWLKIKNKFKYKKITFESYCVEKIILSNKYNVVELISTIGIEENLDRSIKNEISKEVIITEIAYRIKTEYGKYKNNDDLEWWEIAARKIYSSHF